MKRVSKRSSSPNGWQGYFARPIHVQNGPRFVTLEDARSYILGLPKEKQGGFWDPAIRSLLKAADTGDSGDIAHAKTSIEVAFMIQGQLTG